MASAAVFSIFGLLVLVVLLLAPVIIGVLLIVKSRGRGAKFPSCGFCGYDVSGTVGTATRCPECGKDFVAVGILPPVVRRNPLMLWSGILILLVPVTCVGFGGVLHLVARQRMATAQQMAATVQAQAVVAQQAQANSFFPIPAPVSDEQIGLMSVEEASAAMAQVSAAFNRTDLTNDDRSRLQHEFQQLAIRTSLDDRSGSGSGQYPAPLTDAEIDAMSLSQAQQAFSSVSAARRNGALPEPEKTRLSHEMERISQRIKAIQSGS